MGRRGPPPKPTALKLLMGNPGKRKLSKAHPASASRTTCPSWLSAEAKREWRRLAPELERMGLLTSLDRTTFAAYCESYARWMECMRFIQEHGTHYTTPRGQVKEWPQVSMANQSGQAMRAFAGEIGLTPNSRLRLNIGEPEREEDDFDRFLNRTR